MIRVAPIVRSRGLRVALLLAIFGSIGIEALAAPSRGVHEMEWKVHIDLIDPGAGQDLAFFTALLQERMAESNVFLQGHQGPFDSGCCVDLDPISVTTFGTSGDGLDVITTSGELNTVFANPGNYLVEAVWFCSGTFNMSIAGCAQTPGDRLVVGFEIEANQRIPATTAHERGHNAGLNHVSNNDCELMRAGNGGGCISVSECNAFIADADSTSGSCECLADTVGDPPVTLGTMCTPDAGGSGFCGGGVCGVAGGEVETLLYAAGGIGAATGNSTTSLLTQTPASADWDDAGAFGGTITGLAYDRDDDVLYGIESLAGDDALVIVDPTTGAITSTVGTLGGIEEGTALAFDADAGGDRLLLIEVDDDFFGNTCLGALGVTPPCFSAIFEVDPSDASTTFIGEIGDAIITDGVTGAAWDETAALLYIATRAGLRSRAVTGPCPGLQCLTTFVDNRLYSPASLAWDPNSGDLLRSGFNGVSGSELERFDPSTSTSVFVRGIDQYTAGGLAAGAAPLSTIVPTLGVFGGGTLFAGILAYARRRARPLRRG